MSATYDDLVRAIGMQNDCIDDLRAEVTRLTQERDDAEARGEAMFEKLQPALVVAEAEIERLEAALREALSDAHDAKPLQANQYPDQDDDQQDDVEEGLGDREIR